MDSKAGKLNTKDWKAAGKAAIVWSIPLWLWYISTTLGVLQVEGHKFMYKDLVPNELQIGGFITYVLMQIQGTLLRWQRGDPKSGE